MEDDKKGKSDECVNVVVRCRPLNRKEKEENRSHIVTIDVEARQVAIKNPAAPDDDPKSFTFDGAYDENTQQRNFYEECCFSMIESVLEGFNGTIFAYGQTGCGKSFTMQGPNSTPELRGVIPNSFTHIFDTVRASTDVEYLIRCSYLEIYNEEIKDLLGGHNKKDNAKCELKEDPQRGVFVKGLTDVVVETEEQMSAMLEKGLSYRTTSATLMNAESSRSHSIFTIVVEMSSVDKDTGKELLRAGKLNLVDLAGSERQKKTGATGDLLKEGAKINLSLSALGNVISALSEGKGKHIPYRDSKLTRLLQDSLGGNTKTLMVAAISPADYNFDETMSTLRYANRAKNIKNKPKINEDPKDTMIREFKAEIERLRKLLEEQASLVAAGGGLSAEMVGNLQREASSSSIHAAGVSQRGEITSFASDDGSAQGQGQGGRARKRINRARQEAEDYIEEGDAEEGDGDDDEGGDGAASSSEKKARRRAAAASSASAGAGEPIVKEVVVEKERIVVEKEIVTVEVEKIPDDHIYEKQVRSSFILWYRIVWDWAGPTYYHLILLLTILNVFIGLT
jgi:kinesin family protein 3/17